MNQEARMALLAATILAAVSLTIPSTWAQDTQRENASNTLDEPTNLKVNAQLKPEDGSKGEGDDATELAKKLSNPVADLISVPFQMNFNLGGGVDIPDNKPLAFLPRPVARLVNRLRADDRDQAFRFLMNIQPVIPINLSDNWNLISRTILPVISQDDVLGTSSQGGLGDTTQSFFLSPKSTEPFIWGAGPVFLIPTATDHNTLGSYRWGMGPTGVILKQTGPWTFGALANHIWSFARNDGRKEVNSTYLQPFLTYTFKTATSISFNTESTYDWIEEQWTVPVLAGVSQIVKIGKLPVQFQLAGQYWAEGPDSAPDWSTRFQVTFLFPK